MNRDFLDRGKEFTSMLESSRYMCGKNGVDPHCTKLPEVTEEDVERCKKLVSGHIRLMRRSTPEYYKAVQDVLSENKAVLLYTYINFDIFGRYGNQKLKDELAAKNIRLGATLSEKNAGTNAAVMASRSPKSVWVVGNEHYMDALKPYACYAFRINGKYGRSGYIVLMTYRDNLDERIVKLFRLIESTECIITAGLVAKDVIMRDAMQRNEYSKSSTSDIVIMVDNSSTITFANDMFYEFYNHAPLETINSSLGSICPELEPLVPLISQGKRVMGRQVELVRPSMETEQYFVDMSPINTNSKRLGMLITLYKGKAKAASAAAGGNAARYTFGDLIGVSEPFVQLKRFAEEIAATPSPILIQGESGTGKELFANAIHCASQRRDKPFVAINCAAIPRDLIGSELFGYVGGSFTGASRTGAKGKFELADGGTLFLDEIGEMPVEMQSVLLRALEENTITRIGATKPINVDVRIITATNKDLPKCISEGSFRADLYYRLSVINLNMVPLRQRREDIPVLADYFLKHFAASNNKPMKGISTEAMTAMMEYAWPGNVRELRNAVERGVIVSKNGYIEAEDMPEVITGRIKPQPEPEQPRERVRDLESFFERQRLDMAKKLMVEFKGNKSKVAQKMGISRSTLYRLLNRTGEV
ncbi:MAG TPA: sigma 54-interacting transcriptional regulator [Candidatus Scatomorpha intestinigallinarum]|uniref:Sigma 54-interacting transcriptional regulator n=1 Tax=Candidatus Scatomorpha intestinigallinarum TaxID=2840923 RepID=A0A9D1DM82_9FIRM|nr:sigma 54-interacting transcriptional regulator [Candidatus Scatomorpha intestinigallinarum]